MRRLLTSHLIRIYTVCYSVIDLWLKLLFTTMNVSKFKDGRVDCRNSEMKGLMTFTPDLDELEISMCLKYLSSRYSFDTETVLWCKQAGNRSRFFFFFFFFCLHQISFWRSNILFSWCFGYVSTLCWNVAFEENFGLSQLGLRVLVFLIFYRVNVWFFTEYHGFVGSGGTFCPLSYCLGDNSPEVGCDLLSGACENSLP